MKPSPPPTPLDVFVHNAPAADWQVWAAFAPLIAAIVAALIAGAALWQKHRADNRAEWWRRAQWALDASMAKDNATRAEMGQKAINLLAQSKLATPGDGELLKIGTEDPLKAAELARNEESEAKQAQDEVSDALDELNKQLDAPLPRVDDPGTTDDNEEDNNDNKGR